MQAPSKPSFREAFLFWLKLGFISFGGPAGQIALMHAYLVRKKKWISESRFRHALNYCTILPGPEAQQLSIYSGWLLHGVWGGVLAGVLFVLPSVFILLVLSLLYVSLGDIPWFRSVFDGLKPAIMAIVLLAIYRLGKRALHSVLQVSVAVAGFAGIYFLNIPFPLLIVSTVGLSLVIHRYAPAWLSQTQQTEASDREETYYINSSSPISTYNVSTRLLLKQTGFFLLLWVLPFAIMRFAFRDHSFWYSFSLFFTKAAWVTFGGAYAVLPYVAQMSVEKLHWLSGPQMLDGLALGESTPGPLIMVLAYVGFMGSYTHFGASAALGSLGLFVTVYYTFLPCFFFVLAGGPIAESSRASKRFQSVLPLVGAVVTGMLFNLAVYLGKGVFFLPGGSFSLNLYNVIGVFISVFAMLKYKVNLMAWIGISALAGLIRFYLGY
jgi:chromate transporter